MGVERRVGKLIEATRELMDKPLVAHACDGGARDALFRKLGHSSDALTFEQGNDAIFMGFGGSAGMRPRRDTFPSDMSRLYPEV